MSAQFLLQGFFDVFTVVQVIAVYIRVKSAHAECFDCAGDLASKGIKDNTSYAREAATLASTVVEQ